MSVRLAVLRASLAVGVCMGVAVVPAARADEAAERQAARPAVSRTIVDYAVPDIALVRDDGRKVALRDELDDGRPLVLNFIYTTCSGICPLASHILSEVQRELGGERDQVHLVSISIDPDEDTPPRLREYARRYSAGRSWQHYTGAQSAILAVQRAFGTYQGDKMGHTPVTLVRAVPGGPWVRFDGFATPELILEELRGSASGRERKAITASATQ